LIIVIMQANWIPLAFCLALSRAAMAAQTNEPPAGNADTLVLSARQPLPAKERKLRQEVYARCKEMLDAPAGIFGAHPSAAMFPGPVATNAARITRRVELQHRPPRPEWLPLIEPLGYSDPFAPTMYSTGLYAAPGEVVTVAIPKELGGKLAVQIGCHSDNLNQWVAGKEDWRRMPLLVSHRKLEAERTPVSNPFGGLVYITCPPRTEAWQGSVTISNAVMAPWFILGQTTEAAWKQMVESTGAPWGELATENIILMLPLSVLRQIGDPEKRMKMWDAIIGATMDLAQLPMPFYRAQRLVTDVHMGGGFMHSGYPIMVHHCPEQGLKTEEFIADPVRFSQPANGGPNWGFFHEIGHNMQNLDWVFDGTTEVSVNFFSLYCFDKVAGGRDAAHPGISNETTRKMLKGFFSKPADFAKWKKDPFLGLLTFRLIQNDFGWDLFKRTFQRYHKLSSEERPRSDQQKRDRLVRYLSESAGRNFAPYFTAWGIPLSDELSNSLKKHPEWMPYNFPPRTL
jgi:hypothetical protein